VQRRYHFFFIFPCNASHGHDEDIQNFWFDLLGQNVIFLDDEHAVSETIALTIGLTEEAINLADGAHDLSVVGASSSAIDAATKALQPYASEKHLVSASGETVPGLAVADDPTASTPKVERI
jgi:hypothetical protein